MKQFLISYDLAKPGKDYTKLIGALEKVGAEKVLYSEWIVKSIYTATQLVDYLQQFVDGNDMLLLLELTGTAAWTKLRVTDERFKQLITV